MLKVTDIGGLKILLPIKNITCISEGSREDKLFNTVVECSNKQYYVMETLEDIEVKLSYFYNENITYVTPRPM